MKNKNSVAARWARIVRQQRASGLTVAAYCRRHDLAEATFYHWRRKVSAGGVVAGSRSQDPGAMFVEAKVEACRDEEAEASSGTCGLELVLSGGQVVRVQRGFDAQLLREVVLALEVRS